MFNINERSGIGGGGVVLRSGSPWAWGHTPIWTPSAMSRVASVFGLRLGSGAWAKWGDYRGAAGGGGLHGLPPIHRRPALVVPRSRTLGPPFWGETPHCDITLKLPKWGITRGL